MADTTKKKTSLTENEHYLLDQVIRDYQNRVNQGGGPQNIGGSSISSPALANDIRDYMALNDPLTIAMNNYKNRQYQGGGSQIYGTPPPAAAQGTNPNPATNTAIVPDTKTDTKTDQTTNQNPNQNTNQNSNPSSSKKPTESSTPVETPVEEAVPQYQGTYQEQIDQMLQEIMSGGELKYDFAVDPIFQQYAERYNRNGQLAMMDTMAQAAALTGGYGSTYGQQVGQQAYNGYMQDLNAVIPDLYEMAYDRYLAENDRKRNDFALLQGMDDIEYNRFMDNLAYEYQKEQDALAQENYMREFYAKYPHLAPDYIAPKPNPGGGGGNPNNNDEEPSTDEATEDHIIEVATQYAFDHPTQALDSRTVDQYVADFIQQNGYSADAANLFKSVLAENGLKLSRR